MPREIEHFCYADYYIFHSKILRNFKTGVGVYMFKEPNKKSLDISKFKYSLLVKGQKSFVIFQK